MSVDNKKSTEILNKLTDIERGYTSMPLVSALCGAYVLLLAQRYPGVILTTILNDAEVDKKLKSYILHKLMKHWLDYVSLLTAFTEEELRTAILSVDVSEYIGAKRSVGSSLPICNLVNAILDVGEGESGCDIGCAFGDSLCAMSEYATKQKRASKLVGYEISPDCAAIADIRMRCASVDAKIIWDDAFDSNFLPEKFDKVFSNPPMCMPIRDTAKVAGFIRRAFPDFPEIPASVSSADWLFVARAAAAMKEGGRAVVVLPASAMMTKQAEAYRRYFLQRNMIEAIIELPDRLFGYTTISTFMVVLSEGNESVRMIKACDLCERGRRNNIINDDHVQQICSMLTAKNPKDCKNMVVVPKGELIEDECNLTVFRHFAGPVALRNGVPFGELIAFGRRGAAVSSKELDELVITGDLGIRYVSTGNINDGIIDSRLMRLRRLPAGTETFCARNGDLLISRVMAKDAAFKIAVVELSDDQVLLPNGNLLVITLDGEKADPYYIKSYLETEYAQRHLQNASVGNAVKTLQFRSLEQLPVPCLALERQREIGNECRAVLKNVVFALKMLEDSRRRLSKVFSDNADDCFVEVKEEA